MLDKGVNVVDIRESGQIYLNIGPEVGFHDRQEVVIESECNIL